MKLSIAQSGRIAVTLIAAIGAIMMARALWNSYVNAPWTRDARVRADVVNIAPDVAGLVDEVFARDNAEVKKGDILFRVDRERFEIALREAEAIVEGRAATLEQARRELERYEHLRAKEVVSRQNAEQAATAVTQADAAYRQALSARDLARINLERSDVKAPVDGIVTNLQLQKGDYVTTGKAVVALLNADSLRVEGYFEETKLPRIRVGDSVTIRLMGELSSLRGHVESIAAAIEDRERTTGAGLLANINPTFNWVRLAQRVPVRIAIDRMPSGVRLVAGQTATVEVDPDARPRAARVDGTTLAKPEGAQTRLWDVPLDVEKEGRRGSP
ncbi:HlyD family secretion protein [Xanthobacter sp. V3C-3]|uniref:efflux RND transporter periplasmic adaptor subunit n=1 Tax=Xanthobacter lutulentifluminis TaxID=3119935 RepID=UPI00372B10E0